MIRVTTPKHTFTFQVDPSEFSKILITYSQNDQIVLQKQKDDLTIDGMKVYYKLTQSQTKLFSPNSLVEIQVRVKTQTGDVFASELMKMRVADVLNQEVL